MSLHVNVSECERQMRLLTVSDVASAVVVGVSEVVSGEMSYAAVAEALQVNSLTHSLTHSNTQLCQFVFACVLGE